MTGPRYKGTEGHLVTTSCEDCGVAVTDRVAHTRFHSILSGSAWALAVLKTSHIGPGVHDRYDAVERIDRKKFDNWSADALAEVAADLDREG
jgi:hypothetical protein